MELTNSFPPVDAMIQKVKEFDYVKFGDNVIQFSATVSAIAVGVVSYFWTALLLWWNDNGENSKNKLLQFLFNVVVFIAEIAVAIPKLYRWVQMNINRLIDSAFYQIAFN